jgi:hypothetical protein
MITIRVLEAIDHVHPLVLVGLPGEDVERKAGHWAQTVRRGCSLDVEMNSATILSSRTELEKISAALRIVPTFVVGRLGAPFLEKGLEKLRDQREGVDKLTVHLPQFSGSLRVRAEAGGHSQSRLDDIVSLAVVVFTGLTVSRQRGFDSRISGRSAC